MTRKRTAVVDVAGHVGQLVVAAAELESRNVLSTEGEANDTDDTAIEKIQSAVMQRDAAELDTTMNQECRQAGTIAYSSEEYLATEQGKNNVSLYELIKDALLSRLAGGLTTRACHPAQNALSQD